jgi:tetratricopeptide (TPR) repeat protein
MFRHATVETDEVIAMKNTTTGYFMVLLLAGLSGGVSEARPTPAPLDQEEYLDAEDWFRAGLAMNSAGNFRDAAEAFSRSIAIDPENPLSWLNLGTAQALLGDFPTSISSLRKAVRLDPKLAMGFANLAEVYFRTERFQEALECYTTLLDLKPEDSNAHYKRGLAFLLLNQAGKAQAEYLLLKMLDPELAAKLLQAINNGVTTK